MGAEGEGGDYRVVGRAVFVGLPGVDGQMSSGGVDEGKSAVCQARTMIPWPGAYYGRRVRERAVDARTWNRTSFMMMWFGSPWAESLKIPRARMRPIMSGLPMMLVVIHQFSQSIMVHTRD